MSYAVVTGVDWYDVDEVYVMSDHEVDTAVVDDNDDDGSISEVDAACDSVSDVCSDVAAASAVSSTVVLVDSATASVDIAAESPVLSASSAVVAAAVEASDSAAILVGADEVTGFFFQWCLS